MENQGNEGYVLQGKARNMKEMLGEFKEEVKGIVENFLAPHRGRPPMC